MDTWIKEKLSSRIADFKGLDALDLGCGEGQNSFGLAKLGAQVTAIDQQEALLKNLQNLAHAENLAISTKQSKIQNLQIDTQYDIVLFTFVLHFFPAKLRSEITQKVINSVRPGGTLVFADLEDNFPVDPEQLTLLETSLKNIEIEKLIIEDEPHPGMDYLHRHKTFYLIGTKK